MPEYKYVCQTCKEFWFTELPISFNPKEKLGCIADCDGKAERRIGFRNTGNQIVICKGKTVGEWYKKQTGKEFLEG